MHQHAYVLCIVEGLSTSSTQASQTQPELGLQRGWGEERMREEGRGAGVKDEGELSGTMDVGYRLMHLGGIILNAQHMQTSEFEAFNLPR